MKVSFLIAYDRQSPYQWSLPPLGIGYLSAYAKQECWWAETTFHHRVEDLIAEKPDLAAISSSTENFKQAIEDARSIRAALGGVPILLGGMHITSLPHVLPPEFNAGGIGEGELTFVDLLKLYHVKRRPDAADFAKVPGIVYHGADGKPAYGPERKAIKDLDSLPYPDRETIDKGWGLAPSDEVHLISSRGCPYRCSFCSSAKHWKTFRFFSAEYVAREIEYLREKYNPRVVYFFDDLFIGHVGRWREVVRIFRERGIHKGVRFRGFARVDLITEQMAAEFAELNFKYIDFGFESNSAKILKALGKTHVTPEVNQRAVDFLWKHGISIGANFILGSPTETKEDLLETYDFAIRNKDYFDRFSFGPLQPLPGTVTWDAAMQKGVVSEDMDWSRLGFSYETFDFDRFPFLGDSVSREDFREILDKFYYLMKDINYVGQIRSLIDQRDARDARIRELEGELARLRGSRVVRAAMKIRDWRQSFSRPAPAPSAPSASPAPTSDASAPPTSA